MNSNFIQNENNKDKMLSNIFQINQNKYLESDNYNRYSSKYKNDNLNYQIEFENLHSNNSCINFPNWSNNGNFQGFKNDLYETSSSISNLFGKVNIKKNINLNKLKNFDDDIINTNSVSEFDYNEIDKITRTRKEIFSDNQDWRFSAQERIDHKFNEFRQKLRTKIFEKKFELINNHNQANVSNDLEYDISKRLIINTAEHEALDIIKRYIDMGLIKEDCYKFENFDFINEISYCLLCDSFVYLIDKKLVICSGNCFNFTINPLIMKELTLDNVVQNLLCEMKKHGSCNSEIIMIYIGEYHILLFQCAKCYINS